MQDGAIVKGFIGHEYLETEPAEVTA